MKLSPDQIKKISLSLIGLVALVYCYFTFLLGPLQTSQANMINATADLESKVAASSATIKQTSSIEKSAATSVDQSEKIRKMIPAGAPLAWFPPQLKSFFAADGAEVKTVSFINAVPLKDPNLSAYAQSDWSIEIPRVDFLALGQSLARLENTEPLAAITSVRIRTIADDPGLQQVTLGINRVVFK